MLIPAENPNHTAYNSETIARTPALISTTVNAFRLIELLINCFFSTPIHICTSPRNKIRCTTERDGTQSKNTCDDSLNGVENNKNIAPSHKTPGRMIRKLK